MNNRTLNTSVALGLALLILTVTLSLSTTSRADAPQQPLRLAIIGDSTVSEYPENWPDRGWGHFIEERFKEGSVKVFNLAKPGRSTKTFISEGLWQKMLELKPDTVLIQFGHNDSHNPDYPEATDPQTDYKDNLRRYVDESRAIGATPILITPVVRRTFDEQGHIIESQPAPNKSLLLYANAMKEVGEEKKVPVIDLYASSKALVEQLGPEKSVELANKKGDVTHFNAKGARAIADLVMKELPNVQTSLKELLKTP